MRCTGSPLFLNPRDHHHWLVLACPALDCRAHAPHLQAYWEEPWLEELYHKMSRELDLSSRIRTLNRKLDYAHQVVEVLRDDISEKHHTRLEVIIIGLIAIEVLFGFLHFFI